ncbi:PfkB family carbohydrate kinase [Haloferula rosea]|uniref:Carbohydrate kinase n=1 Tax=Haloferula rosea TaxID=490093 RepID=A0A934RCG1_9BACT|nr:PfkB family carbohydrate kinase [Haloferula rosea]MBK1828128.1 carbohydrate kinase [Haloferula rosea]
MNSQSQAILVGGTVAIDNVKTPGSEGTNLLGGSASYAALAASFFTPDVRLIGIVGKDFPAEHLNMLENRGVSLTGVERSEGDSFTWSGEYLENMNERVTHTVGLNVLESWEVKVPAEIADAPIVVLANMSPDNQLQMLEGCTAPNKFVIADTMDLWIEIANERLHEVLKQLDLFVINESEAREFAGTGDLIEAGRILLGKGPRHVVIKLGEFGAMLFTGNGQDLGNGDSLPCPETFFRCAAFPLKKLADPTGAGDTFLGGLAGYLAANANGDYSFEQIRKAVAQGSVVASFTCEAFSTRQLEAITQDDIDARMEAFRQMSSW